MSDASVGAALRTPGRLIVVEAPAGCGKTHQAAEYAAEIALALAPGRVLILAHTHAACDTFATRTPLLRDRVDVRTIDSLIVATATAYHRSVNLPADPGAWARGRADGYAQLASRVARLLETRPTVARMLATRFPVIICDEYQDASDGQHAIVMALHDGGARVRIFGDPMQRLFETSSTGNTFEQRWTTLKASAAQSEALDYPHRWEDARELGQWTLEAREALRNGGQVDLTASLPHNLTVVRADNQAASALQYQLSQADRSSIDAAVRTTDSLLILAAHTRTVHALRAFFNRRFPIWEGHVRDELEKLATAVQTHAGDSVGIVRAAVAFIGEVCTGFSPSRFSNRLCAEVAAGCSPTRHGLPSSLQSLGHFILAEPNHRGLAKLLRELSHRTRTDAAFADVRIDYAREFADAVALGAFDEVDSGMAEIAHRRRAKRPMPAHQSISTIHKSKGLQCSDVLLMPCDQTQFPDKPKTRRLLYVALSRAMSRLTIVVPRSSPSPLVKI